jgi:hypothetical protein
MSNPTFDTYEKTLNEKYFLIPRSTVKAYLGAATIILAVGFGGSYISALNSAQSYANTQIDKRLDTTTLARIETLKEQAETNAKTIGQLVKDSELSSKTIDSYVAQVKDDAVLRQIGHMSQAMHSTLYVQRVLCEELLRHELKEHDTFWNEAKDRHDGIKDMVVHAEDDSKGTMDYFATLLKKTDASSGASPDHTRR